MQDANRHKKKICNYTGKGHEEYAIVFLRHTTVVRVCVAPNYVLDMQEALNADPSGRAI
jgi:hypothetical protein